jgi:hypothetical protein
LQRINTIEHQKHLVERKRLELKSKKGSSSGSDQNLSDNGVQPCSNMDEILKVGSFEVKNGPLYCLIS